MAAGFSSRLPLSVVVVVVVVAVLLLLLLTVMIRVCYVYHDHLRMLLRLGRRMIAAVHGRIRRPLPPKVVVAAEQQQQQQEPWPRPPTVLPYDKIMWAFWDKGEGDDNVPQYCQQAVQSWKARNPSWKIIILSDHNYKQYVAMEDLPSTFRSLQVEHRSDFVRMSVLKRYGGLYLDITYLLFKGMDDLWKQAT